MIAATGSFFSRISDPRFGGTYMTLLNAISNFGFVWASTLGLKCIDLLTFKSCSNNYHNSCSTADLNNVINELLLISKLFFIIIFKYFALFS